MRPPSHVDVGAIVRRSRHISHGLVTRNLRVLGLDRTEHTRDEFQNTEINPRGPRQKSVSVIAPVDKKQRVPHRGRPRAAGNPVNPTHPGRRKSNRQQRELPDGTKPHDRSEQTNNRAAVKVQKRVQRRLKPWQSRGVPSHSQQRFEPPPAISAHAPPTNGT